MKIQYYHYRIIKVVDKYPEIGGLQKEVIEPKGGKTFALEVPPAWFLESIKVGDFFEKKLGSARCSDEDNYNRKVGREIAHSRMKPKKLTVVNIVELPNQINYVLSDSSNYYLLKKNSGGRVYFLGVIENE